MRFMNVSDPSLNDYDIFSGNVILLKMTGRAFLFFAPRPRPLVVGPKPGAYAPGPAYHVKLVFDSDRSVETSSLVRSL